MLPKTIAYKKCYDGKTKWMFHLIEDDELVEIYTDIWNRVSNSIKKGLDFKPVYNNKNF